MNAGLSPIEVAKEQLSITQLWAMLNLPGKPGRSCNSPFREDRNPSFSIYDGGRKWKDHATGEGGDAVDFVAAACNLSPEDGAEALDRAGGRSSAPERTNEPREFRSFAQRRRGREGTQAGKLAGLRGSYAGGNQSYCRAARAFRGGCFPWGASGLALLRGFARRPGLYHYRFAAEERAGRASMAQPWTRIGAKAWTLPGSEAAWPIGLREASSFSAIALVEGGPDLLASVSSRMVCRRRGPSCARGDAGGFQSDSR